MKLSYLPTEEKLWQLVTSSYFETETVKMPTACIHKIPHEIIVYSETYILPTHAFSPKG
jgi:hypothetical protein